MLTVTYYGNATFSIASPTTTVIIDPFFDDNDECPWSATEVVDREQPDLLCITHSAGDHIGDTLALAQEYGLPVITEAATGHYLRQHDVPDSQITQLVWGMHATINDLTIHALEAHHVSIRTMGDELVTGHPLAFLVETDDASVHHLGDTSIFSDLQLLGDLYQPDVALIGVGQAWDAAADTTGPVTRNISELSTDEAILAAQWIGSDTVVPMHYLPKERDRFLAAAETTEDFPDVAALDPGESIDVH